ncbi:MAG: hypothetical protein ACYCZD_06160 [Rhodanobacter sp.]
MAALAREGWCVRSGLLSPDQTLALADECPVMHDTHQLLPAHVGHGRDRSLLRGDHTHWFASDAQSAPQLAYATRIDELRVALSRGQPPR